MIGKDYIKVGAERSKIAKILNGTPETIQGPIKIIGWLDTITMIIVDKASSIHLQTTVGHIHSTILSNHMIAWRMQMSSRDFNALKIDMDRRMITDMDIMAKDACFIHESNR
jgi:hypothetical protein